MKDATEWRYETCVCKSKLLECFFQWPLRLNSSHSVLSDSINIYWHVCPCRKRDPSYVALNQAPSIFSSLKVFWGAFPDLNQRSKDGGCFILCSPLR